MNDLSDAISFCSIKYVERIFFFERKIHISIVYSIQRNKKSDSVLQCLLYDRRRFVLSTSKSICIAPLSTANLRWISYAESTVSKAWRGPSSFKGTFWYCSDLNIYLIKRYIQYFVFNFFFLICARAKLELKKSMRKRILASLCNKDGTRWQGSAHLSKYKHN